MLNELLINFILNNARNTYIYIKSVIKKLNDSYGKKKSEKNSNEHVMEVAESVAAQLSCSSNKSIYNYK